MYSTTYRWALLLILSISAFWLCLLFFFLFLEPILLGGQPGIEYIPVPVWPSSPVPVPDGIETAMGIMQWA